MKIYNVISDLENTRKLSFSLRNRSLDQSLLYQNKGAELYYGSINNENIRLEGNEVLGDKDFLSFGRKNIFSPEQKVTLISLGCGKSFIEKYIFENQDYKDINYLGVDSSQEMLNMSLENFKNSGVDFTLLCADFARYNFNELILDFMRRGRKRIFCFFSNTFGNINHTNIIDILYNILNRGEQIWLDVRLKKDNSTASNMEIFNGHELDNNTTDMEKTFGAILEESGIPLSSGYFSKKMKNEKGINALKIEFDFIFNEKTVTNIKGQITFLPEERLRCLQIYYYDSGSLISFFKEHGFKLVDKQEKNMRGQFLFEKE